MIALLDLVLRAPLLFINGVSLKCIFFIRFFLLRASCWSLEFVIVALVALRSFNDFASPLLPPKFDAADMIRALLTASAFLRLQAAILARQKLSSAAFHCTLSFR